MKKLEQQLVSLYLSRKLKDLGVKQDSAFYWYSNPYAFSEKSRWSISYGKREPVGVENETSAFTVGELGILLPTGVIEKRKGNDTHKDAIDVSWETNLCPKWGKNDMKFCLYLAGDMHYVKSDKEADARAMLLIWLIENGLYVV